MKLHATTAAALLFLPAVLGSPTRASDPDLAKRIDFTPAAALYTPAVTLDAVSYTIFAVTLPTILVGRGEEEEQAELPSLAPRWATTKTIARSVGFSLEASTLAGKTSCARSQRGDFTGGAMFEDHCDTPGGSDYADDAWVNFSHRHVKGSRRSTVGVEIVHELTDPESGARHRTYSPMPDFEFSDMDCGTKRILGFVKRYVCKSSSPVVQSVEYDSLEVIPVEAAA